ncbi:MAG TPA: o-succinylbenzoate synthase [Candidatus Binataceae bacterium]|nr:o-succinylbenzoate synthase [Candidatus Binataceae bacterium]
MRIVRASVAFFNARLSRPLVTSKGQIDTREGFLLTLDSDSGQRGVGEASPAYWIGEEQIDQTRTALELIRRQVERSPDAADLREWILGGASDRPPLTPAAACALDTAMLDLEARERGAAVAGLLPGESIEPVEVCALLTARMPAEIADEARTARKQGYRTVKLKVGGREIDSDVLALAALREALGNEYRIRLDANRAWTFKDAEHALKRFARYQIEFIEEPLASARPGDLVRLRDAAGIALALDESINSKSELEKFIANDSSGYVVLKAARIGGPTRLIEIARLAEAAGMKVVVTDSIETAVGMSLAVHVAAVLSPPRSAAGLGGARALSEPSAAGLDFPIAPAVIACGPGLTVTASADGLRRNPQGRPGPSARM